MQFRVFIVLLLLSSIIGCQSSTVASSTGEALDNSPWSGYVTQDCWQSQTVRQLLSEYTENNFSSFDELIDNKAKIYINDLNLVNSGSVLDLLRQPEPRSFVSKAAMIKGFESTAKALESVKHKDVTATTMFYNNGVVETRCAYVWQGKTRKMKKPVSVPCTTLCKWRGKKIVEFRVIFDPNQS